MQKLVLAALVSLPFLFSAAFIGFVGAPVAHGQSNMAGDIVGTVLDPSGAAVAGAKVTATSEDTGAVATAISSQTGAYRFSLLRPGTYRVVASAAGFKAANTTVMVGVGQIVTQEIRLSLGAASETIQVTSESQILQTDTADMTTEVTMQQLQTIPNPGSDITYSAQAKPGVVMNTGANSSSGTLGYGNFSAFGLPGVSNNFTVNGMEVNDPFLNLNNSGPSNLLLGLNDMAETDVVTNAYEVQYGTLAGVQLNSISRSGTDQFHGNVDWSWNGRSMNANDWFNKDLLINTATIPRPFSNFNQWAAGVGGPIWKHKLFFFGNTEGITFITSSQGVTYLPSTTFATSVVGSDGKCDDASSSLFEATLTGATPGAVGECAFYNTMFKLYEGTPNYSKAAPTPATNGFNVAGGPVYQLQLSTPSSFKLTEKLITGRIDANIGPNDKAFGHYKYDHGLQPTYTDPINAAFDAQSDQPDDEGQFSETHTFSSKAVNQFLATGSWYSAAFVNKNPTTELATFPFDLSFYDGFAHDLNNDAPAWPEGRNVTQWQLGDDFSYTAGKHTFKFGVAFKKDDLSDFDTGVLITPVVLSDVAYGDFTSGQSLLGEGRFPTTLDVPLSLYTLGFYAGDNWKATDKLNLTIGVRVERNSNVSCRVNCLSNFGGNFLTLAKSAPLNTTAGAYNAQIKSGLPDAFSAYQRFMIEPRVGFTYSVTPKTVVRGGVGVFTDVFPGTIADTMLNNPPLDLQFVIYGANFGGPTMDLQPGDSNSFQKLSSGANATFQSQFKTGGSYATMATANPNFSAPSMTSVQAQLHYPTYEEWNLQIQQAFTHETSIQIGYVGNRGYHEPDENVGINAYGGFGLPAAAPPAPSFGSVTEVQSEAVSNYHGLVVSWVYQGHGLNTQVNYTWSHALDEISNGGILPFNSTSIVTPEDPYNLRQNYGNSDYDVRQNFSGNYMYQMPYFGGPHELTENWSVGGTLFSSSGVPFTPTAYVSDYGISNYGSGSNVVAVAPKSGTPHHCGPSAATTPCLTASEFKYVTPFGATDRNQFWGPHYFSTDMTLLKGFKLPHAGEQTQFQAGITAYNLTNHPNHGLPVALTDSGEFGSSTYMEGPPTSIYGSGVGGDPSVRIIEFTSKIVF
jgi:outer membrane receptor protein involved in Fe transport